MQRFPFILSKLSPPPAPALHVARTRLLERLKRFEAQGLGLICAPAGYGKTALMAHYGRQNGATLAWLSLDLKDNDLNRFLAHLIGAFSVAGIVTEEVAQQAQAALPQESERAWALLLNGIQQYCKPVVLALDNADYIKSLRVSRQIDQLLRQAPANLRLLIACRRRPLLATGGLRAGGRLLELDTANLAFSFDEVEVLCRQAGVDAGAGEVYQLGTLTEGWITGIRLWLGACADASVQGAEFLQEPAVKTLAYRYIEDYFNEEVLGSLSAPVQQFLYRTCVVNSFDDSLAQLLADLPRGAAGLQRLRQQNLFLQPVRRGSGWYRYHPLLQGCLYRQLSRRDPELARTLHRQAAEWLLQQGHYSDSLYQYGRSHDVDALLEVIEKHTFDLLREGEINEVVSSLANIPARLGEDHFTLAVTEASVVHVIKDTQRIKACIGRIRRLLHNTPPYASAVRLRQTSVYLRAQIAYLGGNLRYGIRLCDRELREPHESNAAVSVLRFHRASCLFALGSLRNAYRDARQALSELQHYGLVGYTNSLSFLAGQIELAQGRPDLAEHRFHQLRPQCDRHAAPRNFYDLFYYLGMGMVRVEQNRLAAAEPLLNQAAAIALKLQPSAALPWVFHHLALLHCAKGDLEHAAAVWDEAREIAWQHRLYGIYRLCSTHRVRLSLRRPRDSDSNRQWLREWDSVLRLYGEYSLPEERLAYGWLQCRQGSWSEAFRTCEQLIAYSNGQGNVPLLIDAYLLLAALHRDKDRNELALQALDRAVKLAADYRLPRLFHHEGRELLELFRLGLSDKMRQQQGLSTQLSHREFVEPLLAAHQSQPCDAAPAPLLPFEQLTKREGDVLALVIQGQSNQEIAGSLFVGISTVKTHINSIFKKLDVGSREEAIRRARSLNLHQ